MKPQLILSLCIILFGNIIHRRAEFLCGCPSTSLSRAEASASFAVHSFNLQDTSSVPLSISNWTFGTAVFDDRAVTGQHYVTHTISLSTETSVNPSSEDLLYTGGAAFVNKLSKTVSKSNIGDSDDCSFVFSQECVTALINSANSTAHLYPGKSASSGKALSGLMTALPKECARFSQEKHGWNIPISTRNLPSKPQL